MELKDEIQSIWKNFLMGDKEAFAFFYNMHMDALFHYGIKISSDEDTVKDAIQEVFLDLYLKRNKNKTNPKNLRFYLILALKRNLIKRLKRNRKFVENNDTSDFEPVYSIEYQIIDNETQFEKNHQIYNALNQLPSKQKEAVYLRFNESLDYIEVARILNISVESARKQVYRAVKSIKEKIKIENFVFWKYFLKK